MSIVISRFGTTAMSFNLYFTVALLICFKISPSEKKIFNFLSVSP